MLKPRQIERIVKGFSNHRRIQILDLLDTSPGLSLMQISERLRINYKTASEHVRRIANAGLINKRNRSSEVLHTLSDQGVVILKFLRKLE
ncbi:MAG: winged helix-turn-helix transcriptional regulator [Candidatus Levybacteria bacterium]|nr:winged helix-turn-helix transcriptional regulator [Candidatus Levybacteria bacterium]